MTNKHNFEKDIDVPNKRLHGNRKDLTGLKVGKLTCLEPVKTGKNKHSEWLCQCECGNLKIVQTYRLLAGRTKSCGDCYHSVNHYIPMVKELQEECKKLKAENEELKTGLKQIQKQFGIEILYCKTTGKSTFRSREILKLKQVLTEIKEICNKESGWVNCSNNMPTETAIFAEQVLQKISECEVK